MRVCVSMSVSVSASVSLSVECKYDATGEAASTSTPTHSHTSYAYARRCELQTFTQMALWHWLNDCSFPIKPIKRGDSASINGPESEV